MTTLQRTGVRPAYSVRYNFKGSPADGAEPIAGLIDAGGTLYGTTYGGGAYTGSGGGLGTVFSITKTGSENVIYNFGKGGAYDGANPYGGLIAVDGAFYGTTEAGGTSGYAGTAFSVSTSGTEKVLYNFGTVSGSADGAGPYPGLIAVNGKLYGTTCCGGAYHSSTDIGGTAFSVSTTGTEHVLHSFGDGSDGQFPVAALLNVRGTLYGTTAGDGASNYGTVFKMNAKTGKESVLYHFKGGSDGAVPFFGSLVTLKGVLYGTTTAGGGTGCTTGCGTVFSITTSGTEHVVYSFKDGKDGAAPYGGLLLIKGKLFGTTQYGGGTACYKSLGCGTIFSVTPSGKEQILHTFTGGSDGENPVSNLVSLNGVLFGTTYGAGDSSDWGTVFSIEP
jgi:uncharacterized repeat protein (TIGR03803 family)